MYGDSEYDGISYDDDAYWAHEMSDRPEWEDRPIDLDEYDAHWDAVREASDELDIDEREDDTE